MEIYSFDRIRIVSKKSVKGTSIQFMPNRIKGLCKYFRIQTAPEAIRKYNWISVIEIVCPTSEFLHRFKWYKDALGNYSISCIEIARDTIYEDKNSAQTDFMKINRHRCLKWSRENFSFSQRKYFQDRSPSEGNEEMNPSMEGTNVTADSARWGEQTEYYGRRTRFVSYNRNSKVNNKPCLHEEFRMYRSYLIKKKTGIKTLQDLADCDCSSLFRRLEDKYIDYRQIDRKKIGKILKNQSRLRSFNKREEISIGVYASHYLNDWNHIKNTSDLQNHLATLRKKKREGVLLPKHERRILKYRLSQLTIPVPPMD